MRRQRESSRPPAPPGRARYGPRPDRSRPPPTARARRQRFRARRAPPLRCEGDVECRWSWLSPTGTTLTTFNAETAEPGEKAHSNSTRRNYVLHYRGDGGREGKGLSFIWNDVLPLARVGACDDGDDRFGVADVEYFVRHAG